MQFRTKYCRRLPHNRATGMMHRAVGAPASGRLSRDVSSSPEATLTCFGVVFCVA